MSDEQKQGGDKQKVTKAFNANMAALSAMLTQREAGNLLDKKPKVDETALDKIVAKVTETKEKALAEQFEKDLTELIDEKIAYDAFVAKKNEEMQKAIS